MRSFRNQIDDSKIMMEQKEVTIQDLEIKELKSEIKLIERILFSIVFLVAVSTIIVNFDLINSKLAVNILNVQTGLILISKFFSSIKSKKSRIH